MSIPAEAIQQLAEAITAQTRAAASAPTVQAAAVSFKAPAFWTTNTTAWFVRLEAAFSTHQPPITNDFHHVKKLLLNSETSRRVQAVIEHPQQSEKYVELKNALLTVFEATQLQNDTTHLHLKGPGDRRPSELLQHMWSLNPDPKTLFHALFLHQLPPEVQRTLAQSADTDWDTLAKTADHIVENGIA